MLDRGRVGHTTSVPQAFRSPALPVQRTRKVRICAIEEFDARPRRARYTNSRNERTACQAARPAPAASGEPSSRPAVLSAGRTRDRTRQPGPRSQPARIPPGQKITPPVDKAAKKPAAKRTAKKPPAEAPPADGKVAKTTRKRTAKKTAAMASEVSPNEAPAPSTEMEEAAPAPRGRTAFGDRCGTRCPPPKRSLKLRLTNRRLRKPLLSNPPQGSLRSRKLRPRRRACARHRRTRPPIARLTRVVGGAGAGEVAVVGAATTDEAASAEAEQPEEDEAGEVNDGSDLTADGPRRRRRRRRRRGEEAAPAADDPMDTVLRVREPRRARHQ